MKTINPITVLCTENEYVNGDMHGTISLFNFQFILKANGKILKRVKTATQKWISIEVDKIPGVACPFTELGIEKGSIIPGEVLRENIDFLPAGKIPMVMLHQIVAFFRSVMTYKMGDVVKTSSFASQSSFSHNYEAMIFIIYNPATGYRLGVPTQRVSAASVSYDHDCYDQAAGDVVVVDIH